MIEITNKGKNIVVTTGEKKEINFDTLSGNVVLEGFDVTYPGEYEKGGILLVVKEYNETLFYNFLLEGKHLVIISNDDFDLKEEILSFFGDVDILLIIGSKESAKIFENIESKLVIPYGEGKDLFLHTLGQNEEAVSSYKIKADLPIDNTEFVNLV